MNYRIAAGFLSLAIATGAQAGPEISVSANQKVSLASSKGSPDQSASVKTQPSADGKNVYIIELEDPAVAAYEGSIAGYSATSPKVTGERRLNVYQDDSKRYAQLLQDKQQSFVEQSKNALGRDLKVMHRYQHVFNGIAAELSPEEASNLKKLANIKSVVKERWEVTLTDVGPAWIGADAIWEADQWSWPPQVATRGEGVVVAILDSGVNSDHPSFADIGGDGYDHENPLGSGNYIPGSYCDVEKPEFCNDKVIGAWPFTRGDADPISPEDENGHGSHTASTVAGNVITEATIDAPTTQLKRTISGVAPHANLIIYDVCITNADGRGVCPGAALLAAVEQVVIDASVLPNGIQALNYSISGGSSPYDDPIELGFLNATAAGIYVSASAGNSGPGASTVAHNSPWVATVAAMTHNRRFINTLINIRSDEGELADIAAAGFTAGYGPAALVYAGDFPTSNGTQNDTDPAQCLDPFPEGHFNGEIVICDRGSIARTAKGANVLAGGAGGFVLANAEANGDAVVSDAHVLPGVHIGFDAGVALKDWLLTQTDAQASISGFDLDLQDANGDIMAGFSSRGPYLGNDLLKPDIAAPGVSILAAVANDPNGSGPEYGFLSGTSMSSPHHAGSAALMAAIHPDWTPYEIKSAIMMSAKNSGLRKEDGASPTDHFDVGAGRVDLSHIQNVGLVLNETPENFRASDPALGGDPSTLNIASMQSGNCVEECSWTRTVRNAGDRISIYRLSGSGPDGLELDVHPRILALRAGEEAEIQINANSVLAGNDWNFANLELKPFGFRNQPDLHMPISIKPSTTTDANLLNISVDKAEAKRREVLSYTIDLSNGPVEGQMDLRAELPRNLVVDKRSLTQEINGGSSVSEFAYANGKLSWSGQLDAAALAVTENASPFGYVALADFADPFGCPADNCDDGAVTLNVPEFTFNGEKYTQVIWSVNGTIQAGSEGGAPTTAASRALPNVETPNNLLAPLWTDLNMGEDGDGAEWYVTVLAAGEDSFTVYEWNNIPLFSDADARYTFQVWIQNGDSGNIWFVYQDVATTEPSVERISVGVENATGTVGDSYFFAGDGTAPAPGTDLRVDTVAGGSATFSFQAKLRYCFGRDAALVTRASLDSNAGSDRAIAATRCVR